MSADDKAMLDAPAGAGGICAVKLGRVDLHLTPTLPAETIDGLFHADNVDRAQRVTLYADWVPRHVACVTLEQAALLLVGVDPFVGIVSNAAPHIRTRLATVLNLLQSMVATRGIIPVGNLRALVEPRFALEGLATEALAIPECRAHAQEILQAIRADVQLKLDRHPETRDLREREAAHRAYAAERFLNAVPVAPGLREHRRRKDPGSPVNIRVPVSGEQYAEQFRAWCAEHRPNLSLEKVSNKMLDEDRQSLNIQVTRGRPRADRT
jgi:hypothetical protein